MASVIATRDEEIELRGRVLSSLASTQGRSLTSEDREDLYQEAWACAAEYRRQGNEIDDLSAFLKTVANRRALNRRRDRHDETVDPEAAVFLDVEDQRPGPEAAIETRIDALAIWQIADSLSELETKVLEQRYWQERQPKEIMADLGLDRHRFNRTVAAAVEKVSGTLRFPEEWVEERRQLLVRCVAETATEEEVHTARALVRSDPKVRAMLRELRASTRVAAAILPVPTLIGSQPTSGSVAEQAVTAFHTAKGHATSLFSRLTDPTPLAGVRPGAATAAIAGCLAVGGGATYCATEGLPDPIKPVFGIEQPEPKKSEEPKAERPELPPAQAPAPSSLPTPAPPEDSPPPTPAPRSPQPEPQVREQPPPPPAPVQAAREFGPEQAAPPSTSSGSTESFGAPAPPSPAPSGSGGGGGEFGP